MAILNNKPATIAKEQSVTVSLSTSELYSAIQSILSDPHWSISNWERVEFIYKSDTQIDRLVFNVHRNNLNAVMFFNEYFLEQNCECKKILIHDKVGDTFTIRRSQFSNLFGSQALFDVEVTSESFTPSVTQINYTNGSYSIGNNIDFAVVFDTFDLFIQSGSPLLNLTIGSTTRTASLTSVTNFGVATFNFRYTVQAGDVDVDGIVIQSLNANGTAFVNFAGTPVTPNLSFTPISTNIIIPAPSSNFTVGEISGFSEVEELYNFEEFVNGEYSPVLIVRGVHESNPGVFKTYTVNNNLVRTSALQIPGGDDTQIATTTWNRAASYREQSTGNPILLFRGRPNIASPNRKVYKYNSVTGAVTQLSNTNPSGEDIPEAFFTTTLVNSLNLSDIRTVVLFAALDENGKRKLFKYDTVADTVSKIQDFHTNKDDKPSDFISFTHADGDTFTYFFIDQDPDAFIKGEKTLCRMNKFGTIEYLPTFTYNAPDYGNITITPQSYTAIGFDGNEPYLPGNSFYQNRSISSMTVWGNNLIYFAYSLGASSGYGCLARVDQNGNQSVIASTVGPEYPNCKTVGNDRYPNPVDGNFYFTVDENPNFSQPTSYRIGYITPTLEFVISSEVEIGNASFRIGTSAGILYASGTNTVLNRTVLMLYPELSIVGSDWVIPNAQSGESSPGESKVLTMAEHDGYFYFPADLVPVGQTNPVNGLISKLRRVPLTNAVPIESELVFNLNNEQVGERVSDVPFLLHSSMGRLFFTILDVTDSRRKLFYITHT
jgi:hypothetical protein